MPLRNDRVTMARRVCLACGQRFAPSGRRQFCSDACRQAAWRRRHTSPLVSVVPVPARPDTRRATGHATVANVVYECPRCSARLLGEQRCPDCHLFCRRVGPGGRCPHCDEPVALADLTTPEGR